MLSRAVAALLIVAAALAAIYRLVVVPWRCNNVEGIVWRDLDLVWEKREEDPWRARIVAERSLASMGNCVAACPTDVNLQMLAGSSLRILGRSSAAIAAYRTALQYDRRPELYMALGAAQLEAGAPREQAVASFVKVGEFLGLDALRAIPDARTRWNAYTIVGARQDEVLARNGLHRPNLLENPEFATPGPNGTRTSTTAPEITPSAAAGWNVYNAAAGPISTAIVPSTRGAGSAIHVVTSAEHSGLMQVWNPRNATGRVRTTAWVFVRRGRIYIGSGDGRPPMMNVYSSGTGRWERISGVNDSCPATVTVIYAAGPGGAEFYVDEISATETLAAPPCES
ncbi:MAG TPA: hypothetical protein VHK90_07340 [Thermoanaerobaculia bacterium]|nr:hypothetical protein [Thermoanaerobaculia bacterium]